MSASRIAAALVLALAGDAFAAQMYKCVENGRTVYQQQACNPQPEAAASAAQAAASAPGRPLKRSSSPSSEPATRR